ncbi:Protein MAIN-LIKE 2 [Linum perenne]
MTHTIRHSKKIVDYDPRFESILCRIGLYQIRNALRLTPDPEVITALIERWRPETNIFHLYHGEATITLEDMHFITGLSVDGLAVTSADPILTGNEELQNYVGRLIGKTPATSYLSSGRIKMSWLHSNFAYREGAIREDDIETIHQWAPWFKDKTRFILLAGYRQLLDEGTPFTWLPWDGFEDHSPLTYTAHRVVAPLICYFSV